MRTLKFPAADLIFTERELHGFATLRAHRRLRILWHDDHAGSAGEQPNSLSPLWRGGMAMKGTLLRFHWFVSRVPDNANLAVKLGPMINCTRSGLRLGLRGASRPTVG